MNRWGAILILALLVIPAGPFADIFKCVSDDGVVKFSDRPCGKDNNVLGARQSLDDLIALALPLRQPLPDPDRITGDLLAHSQAIGALMCPRLPLYHPYVQVEDERHSAWEVRLIYTDDGLPAWDIKIKYRKETKIDGYQLWLTSITVFRWNKPFSPPAMEQMTALKKIGPGEWVAP